MNTKKKILLFCAVIFLSTISSKITYAHQPIIVPEGQERIDVYNPEVSKAYYAELVKNQQYVIHAEKPFKLYINLLVPKNTNMKGSYSAAIIREFQGKFQEIGRLDGGGYFWKDFFEPFGRDEYLQSTEIRVDAPAGTYYIPVYGGNDIGRDQGKYVLVIGEKEVFGPLEIYSSVKNISWLKRNFFHTSPYSFLLSPFGAGFAFLSIMIGMLIGLLWRATTRIKKNLSIKCRIGRGLVFIVLAVVATYYWSIILLILAGYVLFEALTGWCGILAIKDRKKKSNDN